MPVQQSGLVTPSHFVSWVTDGVVQDSGLSVPELIANLVSTVVGLVNFNAANSDTPIPITLPPGTTQYRVDQVIISGATGLITTATCGVFSGPGATGAVVVVPNTAITITASTPDTINNMQALPICNQNTMAFSDTLLYFHIYTPQGQVQTANVSVFYQPLP
jgi:hypothetical protein